MNDLPNATPLRLVLETLLGDNPYNDDYPRDPLITFEIDSKGCVHRVFFALYGRLGTYRGELRQIPRNWPKNTSFASAGNCTLSIERYYSENRITIASENIRRAFLTVAREKFEQDMGGNES